MIYCYKVKFCVNLEYDVLICYLVTSYCILKSTFDDLDWAETHLFIRKNSLSLSDYVDVFKSKSRNVLASCFAAVAEFKRGKFLTSQYLHDFSSFHDILNK